MLYFDTKTPVLPEYNNPETLGGKGYGLVWMTNNGINVPPAIIIPTSMWAEYSKKPKTTMKEIANEYDSFCDFFIEHFGYMPLLSVRSGARVSCPGMMDTILNVGLTPDTLSFWSTKLGNVCALDCGSRLMEMYTSTVLGMTKEEMKVAYTEGKQLVPPTPKEQTLGAIEAVFKSWNNERAKFYRKMHNIPEEWGTAVVLQAMVFGNAGDTSATGVLFTRDPDTGENKVKGEYLVNAQGEDVVAGTVTPSPLASMLTWNDTVYWELINTVSKMEELKGDVQDVEFTIQEGKLYILQTRNAKRTARAAIRIALDYFKEGKLSREAALKRVKATEYDIANQDVLDPAFKDEPWVIGLPASSGVVVGKVVLTAQAAVDAKEPVILITKETTPDDIAGMFAAKGVITMEGGATSHAAVVARGMNKPCVVGVGIDVKEFAEGSVVSFDGATGRIWIGTVPVVKASGNPVLKQFDELLFGDQVVSVDEPVAGKVLVNGNLWVADIKKLVQLVAQLAKEHEVFVDLTGTDTEEVNAFNTIFFPKLDTEIHLAIKALDAEKHKNPVSVFTTKKSFPTQNIKVVIGTGEFGDFLMNEGGYWTGPVDAKIARIMQLKQKAGEDCSVLGEYVVGKQCFQSKSQMIARLLA